MTAAIRLDETQADSYKALLTGIKNGYEKASSRAINKAVTSTRTATSKAVRAEVTLKLKTVNKAITTKKATAQNLSGRVMIGGQGIPLIEYKATFLKASKGGVNYQIYKTGDKRNLKHAFTATMPSGHIGVFMRVKTSDGSGYVGRLPIKEIFGPSIPDIVAGKSGILSEIEEDGGSIMLKEMDRQVDLLLSTQT